MKSSNLVITIMLSLVFVFACKDESIEVKTSSNKNTVARIDTNDFTNSFYDNSDTYQLALLQIEIAGEITNPVFVDFSILPTHSLIVKETLFGDRGDKFIGAYRYDGYSLYDIIDNFHLNKKNKNSFKPLVDLYVEIENDKGDKVVISWGEIYFSNQLHEIIIANKVSRIIPSRTKQKWPIPTQSKLIVRHDLVTSRNILNPTKITIKSYDLDLKVEKGKTNLFSSKIDLYIDHKKFEKLTSNPKNLKEQNVHTIFYGRGLGLHSTKAHQGVSLGEFLEKRIEKNSQNIQKGLFVIAADDGYRAVYTYSELCNRNDQEKTLLLCDSSLKNNGIFKVYPSSDFFSDRAVKAIDAFYYSEIK